MPLKVRFNAPTPAKTAAASGAQTVNATTDQGASVDKLDTSAKPKPTSGPSTAPSSVASQNQALLPDVGLHYTGGGSKEASQLATFAFDKTIEASLETAKRRAAAGKSADKTPAQVLLRISAPIIRAQHAIAEGYDENLQNKTPEEVARRQDLARAFLSELSKRIWTQVPIDEALRAMPQETAALLAPETEAAKQALKSRLARAETSRKLMGALDFLNEAKEAGFELSMGEKTVVMKAQKDVADDPASGLKALGHILQRASAFLESPPAPKKAKKAAGPTATPAQMWEQGLERLSKLEAEVKNAKTPTEAERFRGAMLGLAIGDALGGPTEFMSREDQRNQLGLVTDMIGGGWLHLKPGEYTDDTQMAERMAESIVAKKGFDDADLSKRYVEWLDGDPKDVGILTRQALELSRIGVEPQLAGEIPWMLAGFENAGNGSVMRAAPVALLTALRSDEVIIDQAMRSSAVTHADPRCTWGAAAIAKAVSLIVAGDPDPTMKVAKWLEDKNPALAQALYDVPNLGWEDVRTSGFVVHTVQAAFWALHHAKSYPEGIVQITNLGEDTDTAGATAGILLGAKFGVNGIPEGWREQLQNSGKLSGLADEIHQLATQSALG